MVIFEDRWPIQTDRPCTAIKLYIKYLYDQDIALADQSTGKLYWVQISEYAVAGVNDWQNSNQSNFLGIQLYKAITSEWYRI